jgi:ketosteroid isomerase-like protein
MVDIAQKDIEAIEELHRQDIAATKAQQYERLKSLMDPECIVMPPDGDPQDGQTFLDRVIKSLEDTDAREEVLDLVQDWEELKLLGDYAYERGVVRYVVRDAEGKVISESQHLMRILRRQQDGSWRVYRAMWHAPRRASE